MTSLPTFQQGARLALQDAQLRRNLRKATKTIRGKRASMVAEVPDWQQLREAGREIKAHTMRHLDRYLVQLEESVKRAGGHVHWAVDATRANRIVVDLVRAEGVSEVVKVKSITTDEIGLNSALAHLRELAQYSHRILSRSGEIVEVTQFDGIASLLSWL